jgi:hypothetical protein
MSENESGPVHKRQWSELTAEQRQAAVTLGYDAVRHTDAPLCSFCSNAACDSSHQGC